MGSVLCGTFRRTNETQIDYLITKSDGARAVVMRWLAEQMKNICMQRARM